MGRKYSVKSERWPVQVFFNILDLAGINSWVLYRKKPGKESLEEFLFQLAEELVQDFQHEQKEEKNIRKTSTNDWKLFMKVLSGAIKKRNEMDIRLDIQITNPVRKANSRRIFGESGKNWLLRGLGTPKMTDLSFFLI
ncbi:hypothetical protein TNCV_3122411 [Trichonephila clavipes]|nr:hypothetical protein TNCV_3122411 [Trichonephila clavipes]